MHLVMFSDSTLLLPYVLALTEAVSILQGLVWIAVAAVVLAVAFWGIRKWFLREGDEPTVGVGFSLADLREMHERGELTDEEFEKARGRLIARTQQTMDEDSLKTLPDDAARPPAVGGVGPDSPASTDNIAPDDEPPPADPDPPIHR